MAEHEERTGAVPGEASGETTSETTGAVTTETAAGGEDPRDEQIRLMREENERLRQQAQQRESGTTEGRAEAHPTTPAPSYEQALAHEAREIEAAAAALMRREAEEGQTVASLRAAQELSDRKNRLTAATVAHALRKTEMNTFVASLPKEQQKPFRDFAAQHGHRYGDLDALYDGFEIKLERERRGRSTETVKRAEDIIKRADEGRVSTTTREVTAAEAAPKREKMTGKQYDDEFARLWNSGRTEEALALSSRLNTGKLDVDD